MEEQFLGKKELSEKQDLAQKALKKENMDTHQKLGAEEQLLSNFPHEFKYDKKLTGINAQKDIEFLQFNLREIESDIEKVKNSAGEEWGNFSDNPSKKEVGVQINLSDEEAMERLSSDDKKYLKSLLEKRDGLKIKIQEIESGQIGLN